MAKRRKENGRKGRGKDGLSSKISKKKLRISKINSKIFKQKRNPILGCSLLRKDCQT